MVAGEKVSFHGVPFNASEFDSALEALVEGESPGRAVQLLSDRDPLQAAQFGSNASPHSLFNGHQFAGEKFFNGFGAGNFSSTNYWLLRERSSRLFTENLYARGLLRRLITNEVNTGLTPEVFPDENILGLPEGSLLEWSDHVESLFAIWANDPLLCDWKQANTFGAIQREARLEALISGDVLIFLRKSERTKLPMIELISGNFVQTPLGGNDRNRNGVEIHHGVEVDKNRRILAYWVTQKDGSSRRIPAFGSKSGKRIAWLMYGTDKRMGELRGQPILSLALQSLKEIDRYRDSVQRKAVLTSMYAMFIEKTEDKKSSRALSGGAVRKATVEGTNSDGSLTRFDSLMGLPGVQLDELEHGEKPHAFNATGTDEKFGDFEAAIVSALAWAMEIPPEILQMQFTDNYSASQAAINEFIIYLNMMWKRSGDEFLSPVYKEWLVSKTLLGDIIAPGLLEAIINPRNRDEFGAWTIVDWCGSIKPANDMLKQAKGSQLLIELGLTTRTHEARVLKGMKYSTNVKRLELENEQLAKAMRPILELKAEFGSQEVDDAESQTQLSLVDSP